MDAHANIRLGRRFVSMSRMHSHAERGNEKMLRDIVLHEDVETLLLKMAVICQDICDRLRFHEIHGNAILEAVLLVASRLVATQSFLKGITGLRYDQYIRVR